jgi:hypothetical protein
LEDAELELGGPRWPRMDAATYLMIEVVTSMGVSEWFEIWG